MVGRTADPATLAAGAVHFGMQRNRGGDGHHVQVCGVGIEQDAIIVVHPYAPRVEIKLCPELGKCVGSRIACCDQAAQTFLLHSENGTMVRLGETAQPDDGDSNGIR